MVNFPTRIPDCDSHSPAVLDFFLSSDVNICSIMSFPPLGNSGHVVVSVSIDFPTNSQQDGPFHCIAYDCSRADWDGLCDHLRDVAWDDIFKLGASAAASEFCGWVQVGTDVSLNLVLLLLLVNFVSGFRLELMYIYHIENIRSSLIHLHGFQLLVLLPYFIKITFFICPKEENLLILR